MRLQGEEYSKRLETFSSFTMVLIMSINGISKEAAHKAGDITTDSELTEKEIVEKLLELRSSYSKSLPPVSYDDALEIVCDALSQGYFGSLFEILDSNATLIFVDEDNCISGNRDIINVLVKERCDHLYCSDEETITCDILRIVKGARYGVGVKCILLTYHLENGERQNHVIKVHFDNGQIVKLEVFYPYGPLHLVADEE